MREDLHQIAKITLLASGFRLFSWICMVGNWLPGRPGARPWAAIHDVETTIIRSFP
jgi:hypothetical protein